MTLHMVCATCKLELGYAEGGLVHLYAGSVVAMPDHAPHVDSWVPLRDTLPDPRNHEYDCRYCDQPIYWHPARGRYVHAGGDPYMYWCERCEEMVLGYGKHRCGYPVNTHHVAERMN